MQLLFSFCDWVVAFLFLMLRLYLLASLITFLRAASRARQLFHQACWPLPSCCAMMMMSDDAQHSTTSQRTHYYVPAARSSSQRRADSSEHLAPHQARNTNNYVAIYHLAYHHQSLAAPI
jgi:hypothetical protein